METGLTEFWPNINSSSRKYIFKKFVSVIKSKPAFHEMAHISTYLEILSI